MRRVVGALACLLPRSLLLAGAVNLPELGSWPSCSGQCVHAAGQPQGSAGETRLPDAPILGNGDLGASIGAMWSGVPGRVDHSGGLRIHLGSNQLWAIGGWNQPRRGELHSDAPLPRRVGFGDFSIGAAALGGGNFTATQDIENAAVWARVQKEGVGWLAASIRLAPDENTALVDVQSWWEKPTLVGVNASALPLRTLCRRGDSQQPPGRDGAGMCIEMDGSAQDGCINGSAWAARSPFSADLSRLPITAAAAATVSFSPLSTEHPTAACGPGGALELHGSEGWLNFTIALVFTTNRALCDTPAGCAPPLPAALNRSRYLAAAPQAVASLRAAHAAYWRSFWLGGGGNVWLPGEPLLQSFWRGQQYLMASTSPHLPEVGDLQLVPPAGLYGPFVFGDLPGWAGSYTMDYNTELLYAPMYGSGRGALASAYFRMLMDHTPLARRNAAYYNCSGVHLPANIAPWGENGIIIGEPADDLSIHSNAVFAAVNFVRAWEADPDPAFARSIALPFISDALAFYRDWVVERPDGRGGTMLVDWVDCHDEEDMMQINVSDGGKKWVPGCLQANLLFANAMIRRLSAALPRLAASAGVPVDPSLVELGTRLAPLPTGLSKKGRTNGTEIYVAYGGVSGAGNTSDAADYLHWLYPTEYITRQSPPADVARAQRTIIAANDNQDGFTDNTTSDNSFNDVFASCAVVGVPINQWLPQFKAGLTQRLLRNYAVDLVSGLEGVAAADAVTLMLLQSWWGPNSSAYAVAQVFPLWNQTQSAHFVGLRAKGGYALAANYSVADAKPGSEGRVVSPVLVSAGSAFAGSVALRLVLPVGWSAASVWASSANGSRVALKRGVDWVELPACSSSCLPIAVMEGI